MESFRATSMANPDCLPTPNTKTTAITITCSQDCWLTSRFWKRRWEGEPETTDGNGCVLQLFRRSWGAAGVGASICGRGLQRAWSERRGGAERRSVEEPIWR